MDNGILEVVVGVNQTGYPVDNAVFRFDYGIDHHHLPKDPKEYAKAIEASKVMEKITKIETLPGDKGHYFENAESFRYMIDTDKEDVHIFCGGSFYKGGDYDKIPKVRDQIVAKAKEICQTAKL